MNEAPRSLPANVLAIVAAAEPVLARRAETEAALTARRNELPEREAAVAAAERAVSATTADLGRALNEKAATAAERAVTKAEEALEEAKATCARSARIMAALEAQAQEDDAEIARLAGELDLALRQAGGGLVPGFLEAYQQAADAFVRVCAQGYAIQSLTGGTVSLRWLDDVELPGGPNGPVTLMKGGEHWGPDGRIVGRLTQTWRTEPECAVIAETLAPIAGMLQRLRAHQPFTKPAKPLGAARYTGSGARFGDPEVRRPGGA